MKRPLVIAIISAGILSLGVFGYAWTASDTLSPTERAVESMPSTKTVRDTSSEPSIALETKDDDDGAETMTFETLITEVEAAAMGDEGALEREYAAESRTMMDGAVVIEQLGTSYDETNY